MDAAVATGGHTLQLVSYGLGQLITVPTAMGATRALVTCRGTDGKMVWLHDRDLAEQLIACWAPSGAMPGSNKADAPGVAHIRDVTEVDVDPGLVEMLKQKITAIGHELADPISATALTGHECATGERHTAWPVPLRRTLQTR